MALQDLKLGIQVLCAVALVQSSLLPQYTFAKGSKGDKACSAVEQCKKLGTAGMNQYGADMAATAGGDKKMHNGAGGLAAAGAACNGNLAGAATKCEELKKDCKTCGAEDKVKACNDGITDQIALFNSQAASCGQDALGAGAVQNDSAANGPGGSNGSGAGTGGGGGMGDMMGPLMMAGLVAAMMMKDDEEKKPQGPVQSMGALQQNGTVDCSKIDAYHYRGCNGQLETKCNLNMDDGMCQGFSARFCGPNVGLPQPPPPIPPPPPMPGTILPDPSTYLGAVGEGSAAPYCSNVLAWNYCKTSGRDMCPSCLLMAKNKSVACVQNPALCVSQNSQSEIIKAKQTCPTDPIFSNPIYANIGNQTPSTGAPTGGLPAVQLPQNSTTAPSSGVSTSYAVNSLDTSVNSGYSAQSATAPARGPASDIQGKFGVNLFRTSSAIYKTRCEQGRLNNCP